MPAPSPYDYSTDPILQQVKAFNVRALADAEAQARAARIQQALSYGDSELARSLGLGEDVAGQAGANPFSTLANLRHSYDQGVGGLNESLNKANLWYSSARGEKLGLAARMYQESQANAAQQVQGSLGGINQALLGVQNEAADRELQGQQDAYQRALDHALQFGYNPGATPPGTPGTPGGGTPNASAKAQRQFSLLRRRGQVRPGVGFAQYAANHPGFRTRFGLT